MVGPVLGWPVVIATIISDGYIEVTIRRLDGRAI